MTIPLTNLVVLVAIFGIITLASQRIGDFFARYRLPRITGYLFAGLLCGPFVLGLIPKGATEQLLFVDEISLAFIAFAAGNELYLPELRGRLQSIGWVTAGLIFFTFTLTLIAVMLLADVIPLTSGMELTSQAAVALLIAAILVARSPSSAIAIIKEVRAKGSFTQMALGVTVIMDVLVIVIFAISASFADALLTNVPLNLSILGLVLLELTIALLAGLGLYRLMDWLLGRGLGKKPTTILILLLGYTVFVLTHQLREWSHEVLPFEILVEPLLVCLIASFLVNNRSRFRLKLDEILHDISFLIFAVFFTLTGASLELNVLAQTWPIALALFATRLVGIMLGSFTGGVLAGDPKETNKLKWMAFITQAGVAIGLAKEVAVGFPALGNTFVTMIISVVVINEIIGPIFFKHVLHRVGEAHPRGETALFDGVRDALIFGRDGQAVALARQLLSHGWQVKLASPLPNHNGDFQESELAVFPIQQINLQFLQELEAEHADAIICLLDDGENVRLCELAYEHFGTENLVVRLNDRQNAHYYASLDAHIVDPGTAIVSLLDHIVRSPSTASMLLGQDEEQDIVDVEIRDPDLQDVLLRRLRLPLDTVILSIHRDGQLITPHGHTRLKLGDQVTMIGSPESLDEVSLKFDEFSQKA